MLVDFKLEFGRLADGTVVLADEICPDTCRLWDSRYPGKAGQGPLPPGIWAAWKTPTRRCCAQASGGIIWSGKKNAIENGVTERSRRLIHVRISPSGP